MINKKYPHINAYLVGLKKKIGFERCITKIDTLILGSSHGQYAYVPKNGEYNLCLPSQDLYYSYALYKKYAGKLKNLKKIILFYSVFSCGYELIKGKEDFRCFHYEQIFGIKPNHRAYIGNLHAKYNRFLSYIQEKAQMLRVAKNYCGQNPDTKGKNVWRIGKIAPQERAKGALKHNRRGYTQDKYIEKLVCLAQKHNVKVDVVLSPTHTEYKRCLPSEEQLFAHLFALLKLYPSVQLIDFYSRNDFTDDEWWDYDHLNPSGAKKFTQLFEEIING